MISWLHHDWAFVRRAHDTWERDRDRAVSATSEACAHLDFNWAVTIVTIQQISGWSKTIRLCGRSAPGHTFGGQKFSGSFIFIHLRNLVTAQLQWMLGAPMCSENKSWTVCGGVVGGGGARHMWKHTAKWRHSVKHNSGTNHTTQLR